MKSARSESVLFGILGVSSFLATIYWSFTQPMNPDEMEHLHSTYLVLEGSVPYREFWQNHMPTLWLLFAPLMAVWSSDASICYLARGVGLSGSLLVFLVAVRLSNELCGGDRRAWGANAAVLSAAYWGTSILAEAPIFRTDIWMTLFVLLSAIASLRAEEWIARASSRDARAGSAGATNEDAAKEGAVSGRVMNEDAAKEAAVSGRATNEDAAKEGAVSEPAMNENASSDRASSKRSSMSSAVRWCFAAGACFGVSLCFSTKLLALGIALPGALLFRCRSAVQWARYTCAFAAGVLVFVAPLVLYLFANGAQSDFYRWVVTFNRMRSGGANQFETWWIPTLLVSFALATVLSAGTIRGWSTIRGASARWMLVLALICAVLLYPLEQRVFAYYIAPLIALGAPFLLHQTWARRGQDRGARVFARVFSAVLIGVVFIAGTIPGATLLWGNRSPDQQLRKNLEFIQWMIDAAEDHVVLCNVPAHPIYASDLTPIYIPWQAHYLAQTGTPRSAMLLELLRAAPPFEEQLAAKKPALLQITALRSYLTLLQQGGLIDERGLDRVRKILMSEYREVNETLYVRRAKPAS